MAVHKSAKRTKNAAAKTVGPAHPSHSYLAMAPRWHKMESVLGGTERMKQEGTTYLPMHMGEEKDRYAERLAGALLWNQTELTLEGWVGRPFAEPLKLNDDVPEQIKALEEDIDSQGMNMDAFAREWFNKGLSKAFCHVLIDAPAYDSPDGQPLTLAKEKELGIRPYWVLIDPTELIAARRVRENGRDVITHVRIEETTTEQDPNDRFNEVIVERIRVMDRVWDGDEEQGRYVVVITMYIKKKEGKKDIWVEDMEHESNGRVIYFSEIPLITFYADREGFMMGKSPLQDLVDLNVSHWQKLSDHEAIVRVASFPMLAASGIPEEGLENNTNKRDPMVVGPFTFLSCEEASGRYYYVEHTGKAIKAGVDSLLQLEDKMRGYGAEFLKKRPGRETATARAMDSAESTSPLQNMAWRFKEAFQRALAMTAKMMGMVPDKPEDEFFAGTVEIITDFGPEDISGIDLNALLTARANRDISRNRLNQELERRGILPEDFDHELNKKELEDEMKDTFGGPAFNNLVPDEDEDEEKDDKNDESNGQTSEKKSEEED